MPCPRDGDAILLRMLDRSLRSGHWRVACRRYLMLVAREHAVPGAWREQCEALLARCAPSQLECMRADASRWAAMVGELRTPVPVPEPEREEVPVRTVWRPLPACFRTPSPAA